MKVLYLNSLFPPDIGGGAEITLESIVRGMKRLGNEVAVVATSDKPGTHLTIQDGLSVYRIGVQNIYWPHKAQATPAYKRALWHLADIYNPLMKKHLAAVVEEFKPDVVSIHNLPGFSISAYSVFTERHIPLVQVLHDYYLLCPKVNLFANNEICEQRCLSCQAYRLPHNKISSQASAVVGVSHAVLEQHLNHGAFKETRIKAVINNARALKPPTKQRTRGVEDALRFGFIGTLSEVKGVEPMIDAFLKVQSLSTQKIELLIGGTGKEEYVAFLKGKYQSNAIQFLGRVVPDEFFMSIDVSIVPSVWLDPFPGVVFESLGYGVPVIGAQRGGIPEMVIHEKNGLLYDPAVSGSLSGAITTFMSDQQLLVNCQREAPESVARLLNVDRMLQEHQQLMSKVIEQSKTKTNHA
ncbi:RfaG Glycosyltransferase [Comamonadaceae bacterium]